MRHRFATNRTNFVGMKTKATKLEKEEILQKVKRGLADVRTGRTKSQAEVKEALAQRWSTEGHERRRSRQSGVNLR